MTALDHLTGTERIELRANEPFLRLVDKARAALGAQGFIISRSQFIRDATAERALAVLERAEART